jgi:hypothetical protein
MTGCAALCGSCAMPDAFAVLCCRAMSVLQHLAFVSPNVAELVAMAQAASSVQQRRPNQTAASSQPPPLPPLQQQQQQQQRAEAGGNTRGLLLQLAPHLAVLLQVSALGFHVN